MPVAGGTALMLMMKAGVFQPSLLVCLHKHRAGHSRITRRPAAAIAHRRHGDVERRRTRRRTSLRDCRCSSARMRTLSNPRVRNVARVGGALAHGDPHMDLPPVLAVLGAQVAISGPNGNRELPLEELYAGYYETVLEKNELITVGDRAGAQRPQGRLHESHVAHRRRLAGARRRGLVRARRTARCAIRSSSSAPRPRK